MADDDRRRDAIIRGRDDRDRYRDDGYSETRRGRDGGSDDGYIAQRGFGNLSSGYDHGGSHPGERHTMPDRGSRSESRDFPGGNDLAGGFHAADRSVPTREPGGYRGERSGWDRFSDEVSSWLGDDAASRRRAQDARQADPSADHHRGRGPKGYQRSDERIREDVNDRLTDDSHIDATDIDVTVRDREVTLSGHVASRFEKRHAEDIVESISGVTHVQNNLRVRQVTGTAGPIGAAAHMVTGTPALGPTGATLSDVEVNRSDTPQKGRGQAGT